MHNSAKKGIKIVHVEDSSNWRELLGEAFSNGLSRSGVTFESRADFVRLVAEIEGANPEDLPDILILDNEAPGGEGSLIALRAKQRARELGKDIIVVNLLCSAPEEVMKKHGADLKVEGIPVLNKTEDAAILGFYLGACVGKEGVIPSKIDFYEWVKQEGINLRHPEVTTKTQMTIDSTLWSSFITEAPGCLFSSPREYVAHNINRLSQHVSPETAQGLSLLYPPPISRREK